MRRWRWLGLLALLGGLAGCAETRPDWLDEPLASDGPFVVNGRFGYLHRTFDEVWFLTPAYRGDRLDYRVDRVDVGSAPLAPIVSPDGSLVFTLNAGDQTLSIVDVGTLEERRFELPSDYDALALSPDSRFAVAHFANATAGGSGDSVFRNQNEITIFDLEAGGERFAQVDASVLSLRSSPVGFDFAPEFTLGGVVQRLLVVRASNALALIDLLAPDIDDAQRRVFFVLEDSTRTLVPQRVVFTEDDPNDDRDMRMFVLTTNAQDIFEVSILPPGGDDATLSLSLNQFPAGPTPIDMLDFIDPAGDQKLLVLNGNNRKLVVVDVATGNTTDLDISWTVTAGLPFTLVNDETDVEENWALLFQPGGSSTVVFVNLDQLESRGSRAVTPLTTTRAVGDVRMVPGSESAVVIHTGGNALSVLNLRRRFDIPLPGSASLRNTAFSTDGRFLFTTVAERNVLAVIELDNGHPSQIDLPDPGNRLVVLDDPQVILVDHGDAEGRMTLMDGVDPTRPARTLEGLFLETLLDEAASPRAED